MTGAAAPYTSPYGYSERDWHRLGGPPITEAQRPPEEGKDSRPPFARDHDRLVYTSAFRRLQGKTQVVTPGEADFFRTRLTHTIEVAQIARRLAAYLNARVLATIADDPQHPLGARAGPQGVLDPDACEAAAVLHDLGHPPFGHAGEVALGQAVKRMEGAYHVSGAGSFEGNAQSFRMATSGLVHKPGVAGLQLTRAVLDAALKYPWAHDDPQQRPRSQRKWSVYPTEAAALRWVRADVPAPARGLVTVEEQVMDWADNIAYSIHDLDDWYRAGFMPLAQLARGEAELDHLKSVISARRGATTRRDREALRGQLHALFAESDAFAGFRSRTGTPGSGSVDDPHSEAAREAVRQLRSLMFDDLTTYVEVAVRPEATAEWPRRYALTLRIDPEVEAQNEILRELLWIYVVGSSAMATHQAGQQRVVEELLRICALAARRPTTDSIAIFPVDVRESLTEAHDPAVRLRLVADYVAGMTDAFALRTHARLTGAGARFNEYL